MKPIGGYFDLYILKGENDLHSKTSLPLKSGRACLSLLIEQFQPAHIWVPYYTCDALLEPILEHHIKFSFFRVNKDLEIVSPLPALKPDEKLIYINYFGLKNKYCEYLETKYGDQLWLDHTQAFFFKPINSSASHFNSARKFFGVPDGAYLYDSSLEKSLLQKKLLQNTDYRYEHLILRHQGKIQQGYEIFKDNEIRCGKGIALMSELTEIILSQIDFNQISQKRRSNYSCLHNALGIDNRLSYQILDDYQNTVPFCYPYLPGSPINKEYLWENQIYIPVFWNECLNRKTRDFDFEKQLSKELLPLPIDHRYDHGDMNRILELIHNYAKQ